MLIQWLGRGKCPVSPCFQAEAPLLGRFLLLVRSGSRRKGTCGVYMELQTAYQSANSYQLSRLHYHLVRSTAQGTYRPIKTQLKSTK